MTKDEYKEQLRKTIADNTASPMTKSDIETCYQYIDRLYTAGLPVFFDEKHVHIALRLHGIDLNSYHTFPLSQFGKIRIITAPSLMLKERQRWILTNILSKIPVSPYAHGFEPGCSIKTHAMLHANNNYALCLDIKDFFPSIPQSAVVEIFHSMGYSVKAANMLATLCCFQGTLPQGAPTSPKLSNIFCKDLDMELSKIAEEESVIYSRYADDITFSGTHSLERVFRQAKITLRKYGFSLNEAKIHFYGPETPKRITGLLVQKGTVRVPKHFKRLLKQEIYYCNKYGVLTHLENIGATKFINYREHLYGKAYYVYMIEPEEGKMFLEQLGQIEWPGFLN